MYQYLHQELTPQFRYIKINELEAFGKSEDYARLVTVPITPPRIASHVHNPRADPEDIALILAEDEKGNVLGFIGLLPDFIFVPDQQKVYWISCWWVDKEKGKNLGIPLLYASYKWAEGKLLADSIPETLPVFQKSKLFHIPAPKVGIRLFLQPCIKKIVLRKKPQWASFALSCLDGLARVAFFPLYVLSKEMCSYPSDISVDFLEVIDAKTEAFIRSTHFTTPFQRSVKELNWILSYPWLSEEKKRNTSHYPFSWATKQFKQHLLSLKENGNTIAVLFFTEREGSFKLPYAYFNEDYLSKTALCVEAFLYTKGAQEFTCFHPILSQALDSRFAFAFHHTIQYQYVWGKELGALEVARFQDGDGDAIFT